MNKNSLFMIIFSVTLLIVLILSYYLLFSEQETKPMVEVNPIMENQNHLGKELILTLNKEEFTSIQAKEQDKVDSNQKSTGNTINKPANDTKKIIQNETENILLTADKKILEESIISSKQEKKVAKEFPIIIYKKNDLDHPQKVMIEIQNSTTIKVGDFQYSTEIQKEKLIVNWSMDGWKVDSEKSSFDFFMHDHQLIIDDLNDLEQHYELYVSPLKILKLKFETEDPNVDLSDLVLKYKTFSSEKNYPKIKDKQCEIYLDDKDSFSITDISVGLYYADNFVVDFIQQSVVTKNILLKPRSSDTAILTDKNGTILSDYYYFVSYNSLSERARNTIKRNYFLKKLDDKNEIEDLYYIQTECFYFNKTNQEGLMDLPNQNANSLFIFIIGEKNSGAERSIFLNKTKQQTIKIDTYDNEFLLDFTFDGKPYALPDGTFGLLHKENKEGLIIDKVLVINGKVLTKNITPGNYYLRIQSEEISSQQASFTIVEGEHTQKTIHVKKGLPIKGVVKKKTGTIADHEFHLRLTAMDGKLIYSTEMPSSGTFEFKNLDPSMEYKLKLSDSNLQLENEELIYRPSLEPIEVYTKEPKTIFITLVNSAEKPIYENIVVKIFSFAKDGSLQYRSYRAPNKDGKIEYELFADCPTIRVQARSRDYAFKRVNYNLSDLEQNPAQTIVLEDGFPAKIKILKPDGTPAKNPIICANGYYKFRLPLEERYEIIAHGDENGIVELTHAIADDEIVATATGEIGKQFRITEDFRNQITEITLHKGYKISGLLKDLNGKPLPNIEIILSLRGPLRQNLRSSTDSSGFFSFSQLIPGRWTFQFEILNEQGKKTWHDVYIKDKDEYFEQTIKVKEPL